MSPLLASYFTGAALCAINAWMMGAFSLRGRELARVLVVVVIFWPVAIAFGVIGIFIDGRRSTALRLHDYMVERQDQMEEDERRREEDTPP